MEHGPSPRWAPLMGSPVNLFLYLCSHSVCIPCLEVRDYEKTYVLLPTPSKNEAPHLICYVHLLRLLFSDLWNAQLARAHAPLPPEWDVEDVHDTRLPISFHLYTTSWTLNWVSLGMITNGVVLAKTLNSGQPLLPKVTPRARIDSRSHLRSWIIGLQTSKSENHWHGFHLLWVLCWVHGLRSS